LPGNAIVVRPQLSCAPGRSLPLATCLHCLIRCSIGYFTRIIGKKAIGGIGHQTNHSGKYQPYQAAAVLSSLSPPRITILSASSGARCSALPQPTDRASTLPLLGDGHDRSGKKVSIQFSTFPPRSGIGHSVVAFLHSDPDGRNPGFAASLARSSLRFIAAKPWLRFELLARS